MVARCYTCDKTFPAGSRARDQHCSATGHVAAGEYECHQCYDRFDTEDDRRVHEYYNNHFEFECRVCNDTYATKRERTDHEANQHAFCADCDRQFNNSNNARMHRKSRAHQAHSIDCPFCSAPYTTATGVAHHLEAGRCPKAKNLNRDEIYRAIRSRDPSGVISKKLIGWYGSSTYEATENAWNGWAYMCYICKREFSRLNGLNQHLNSPAHQQNFYHCPQRSCNSEFKTLAAFLNHLESETCGFMRFDAVQKRAAAMMQGGRMIGY